MYSKMALRASALLGNWSVAHSVFSVANKAFHNSIIVAVAGAAHTDRTLQVSYLGLIGLAGV
jgi:hypothetical protein